MIKATDKHIAAIIAERVDDYTREMMAEGVFLTFDQAHEIGDVGTDWLQHRCGLNHSSSDAGHAFETPRHYASEEDRRAGIEIKDLEDETE